MASAIWKFRLELTDVQVVSMPRGARLLCVQSQDDRLCLWALVDRDEPCDERRIRIVGTVQPIADADQLDYIGTAQFKGGGLVLHVFEETTR